MLADLPQFVPSRVCLSCDGCCRFKDEKSSWRPHVSREERKPLVDLIFDASTIDSEGYLKTKTHHGQCECVFFNHEDNTCGIYSKRPFECQLYPFLLTENENGPAVAVHLNCPHIQENRQTSEFETYVKRLKQYFLRPDVADFLRRNHSLVRDYSSYQEELEYLFPLSL